MDDVTVAADAAPAPTAAPITPPAVEPSKPVESDLADIKANGEAKREAEKAAAEAAKKPATVRDSVKAAFDKSKADAEAKAKEAKPETKPEPKADEKPDAKSEVKDAKPEATRAPDGKFAPREGSQPQATTPPQEAPKPVSDAPSRFSDDAKAIWKDTPEPIRRETERAIRELTQGHEKYKADAESFSGVKQFDELARQNGTTLQAALASYVQTEQAIRSNPLKGAEDLFGKLGISFRDLASAYLNQPVEQQQSAKDVEIAQLKQNIQQLQQGFTSFKGEFETREAQQVIDAFKADRPRFEELKADVGFFLQSGRAQTLSEAYELAERLNTAPQASTPSAASSAPVLDLVAQTHKGSKSISGAPSAGSSPAKHQPASSTREALKRAAARLA